MQINHVTKIEYAGGNNDTLNHTQRTAGYKTNQWLTFLQARDLGLTIKKGSKGIRLMRVCEDKKNKSKKFVKSFTVFNIDQTQPAK